MKFYEFVFSIVFVRVGGWVMFFCINCVVRIFFLLIMFFWLIWSFKLFLWKFRIDFLFFVGNMCNRSVIDVLVFRLFLGWFGIIINELGVFDSCKELFLFEDYVMLLRMVKLVWEISFSLVFCLLSGRKVIGCKVEERNKIIYV